jgi:DNA-binding response OmpR family regulator
MEMHFCPHCGFNLTSRAPVAFGNVAIDQEGLVLFEGRPVELGRCAYNLVEALVRARGRGVTKSALASRHGDIDDETINKYVERTRASFRRLRPDFDQIVSLRGFGAYKWSFRASDRAEPRNSS